MKLLIAGLALIAVGLGLVVFTDLNPAILFIGGVACTLIGFIHGTSRPESGPAVSTGDAESLANLHNYGSAVGDAGSVLDGNP